MLSHVVPTMELKYMQYIYGYNYLNKEYEMFDKINDYLISFELWIDQMAERWF